MQLAIIIVACYAAACYALIGAVLLAGAIHGHLKPPRGTPRSAVVVATLSVLLQAPILVPGMIWSAAKRAG